MDPDWVDEFPIEHGDIPAIAMLGTTRGVFSWWSKSILEGTHIQIINPPIRREVILFSWKNWIDPNPKKHQWGPTSIVPSFYFLRKKKTTAAFVQLFESKNLLGFWIDISSRGSCPFLKGAFFDHPKGFFCKKTNHQIPWDYSRFMVIFCWNLKKLE